MDIFAPLKDPSDSIHPEDRDNDSDISEADSNVTADEEDADYEIPGTGPNDMARPPRKTTGSHNTGVKGVIADAYSFESERRRTTQKKQHQKKSSSGLEYMVVSGRDLDSRVPDRDSDDDDDDNDDEFVRVWRKKRLAELQKVGSERKTEPSKHKYGRVESVDAAGYLDAVEKVAAETVVVVTIYDDESEESRFVEDCLNTICRRYVTTRFVRLHHSEAEMEAAVVPAVLAYKAGELFANIIRIVDEIPPGRNLSADSLELVLRRANVLHKE